MLMAEEIEIHASTSHDTLRFFHPLSSRDFRMRNDAMDSITKSIESWLDGYGSPKDREFLDSHMNGLGVDYGFKLLLAEHLPSLLRLSIQCPFEDVRQRSLDLLEDLKDRGVKVPRRLGQGPSYFIPEKDIIPIKPEDDQTQSLFVDTFLQNNRLDHITHVMGYHPQYLDLFLRTQHHLLRGDGPLPFDHRHYIAIMAASRHQCSYLVNVHITEFLLAGGDERWLKGLQNIPQKLQDLSELNKILAHRPWLINKTHIEKLTRGGESWSISELVHALILMAHIHSLSSFVYGCGLNNEIDHESGHTFRPASLSDSHNGNDPDAYLGTINGHDVNGHDGDSVAEGIEILVEKMKRLMEESETIEPTQEELLKRFEHVESQSVELTANMVHPSPKGSLLRYVDDGDFGYQDFAKRLNVSETPTFRAQEYSWEDHGFSLANDLFNDIGNLLDDKFRTAYHLTYYTMGDRCNVDTSSFRRAIWNYIHCMYGIFHDDYDYGEVNQLLERNLKAYVKTVTCYPERSNRKEYDSVMREFRHSEKVHVNLMLFEARLQAELLYSLRAVAKHIT